MGIAQLIIFHFGFNIQSENIRMDRDAGIAFFFINFKTLLFLSCFSLQRIALGSYTASSEINYPWTLLAV